MNAVCCIFRVSQEEIRSGRKHRNVAEARMTAGYLLITLANMGRGDAEKMVNRKHPWAAWAVYRSPDLGEIDDVYAYKVSACMEHIAYLKGVAA